MIKEFGLPQLEAFLAPLSWRVERRDKTAPHGRKLAIGLVGGGITISFSGPLRTITHRTVELCERDEGTEA